MSIVAETSSWLVWIHRAAAMISEDLVLRLKVWGQGVADSARINGTVTQCQSRCERWRFGLCQLIYICGLVILLLLPAFSMTMALSNPESQTRLRTSAGKYGNGIYI